MLTSIVKIYNNEQQQQQQQQKPNIFWSIIMLLLLEWVHWVCSTWSSTASASEYSTIYNSNANQVIHYYTTLQGILWKSGTHNLFFIFVELLIWIIYVFLWTFIQNDGYKLPISCMPDMVPTSLVTAVVPRIRQIHQKWPQCFWKRNLLKIKFTTKWYTTLCV